MLMAGRMLAVETASASPINLSDPNQVYLPGPGSEASREEWLRQLKDYRERIRSGEPAGIPLNQRIYVDPKRAWVSGAFTCHFTFMYDREFWNPEKAEYRLDEFLKAGRRKFGGFDAILLWHAYPRLGIDPRNQVDFYRDMPGGLPGLKELVAKAHRAGTRVFINYNPWDTGTRREPVSDETFLADVVAMTGVDGIFLDTLPGDSPALAQALEPRSPSACLCPELHPAISSLSWCNGSWSQGLDGGFGQAAFDHRKWLAPQHMRWHIDRWNPDHTEEIRRAFFNGSGMLVWENIFGSYNGWSTANRALWRRAVAILREFHTEFASDAWDPFFPVRSHDDLQLAVAENPNGRRAQTPALYCNRWSGAGAEIYVFLSNPQQTAGGASRVRLALPRQRETSYFDAWTGKPLSAQFQDECAMVTVDLEPAARLGCVVALQQGRIDSRFRRFLKDQREEASAPALPETKLAANAVSKPVLSPRTKPAPSNPAPPGMVLSPGGTIRMRIEHQRRECGCYPDPGTPPAKEAGFLSGNPFHETLRHDYSVELRPCFIDEAEVSNADFEKFLAATKYRPKQRHNFLKHWPRGLLPPEMADLPVVYVDLDDARAYAKWAGKRLPTEAEWQLAAQGTDGRRWPWGGTMQPDQLDPLRVNTTGAPMSVRSLPEGRSPIGCYHMAGNVYEWTESERDDGHTRYAIIRGGSYFEARGSIWYADGGPRPCDHHAKFILMWPGLDRCSTIGFRCVKDL